MDIVFFVLQKLHRPFKSNYQITFPLKWRLNIVVLRQNNHISEFIKNHAWNFISEATGYSYM